MALFDVRLDDRPARLVVRTDEQPLPEPVSSSGDSLFRCETRLFRHELLLYPDDGRPQRRDLLIETLPDGLPFGDFIRLHANLKGRRTVRRLLQHLPPLADRLTDAVHSPLRIDSRTLLVTATDSTPVLSGCDYLPSRTDEPPAVALLRLALLTHAVMCEPDLFPCLHGTKLRQAAGLLQALRLQGEFSRIEPLADAAALLSAASPDATAARVLLDAIVSLPFAPMPLLVGLLDDGTDTAAPTPRATAAAADEDRSLLIDFAACDEVCPRADTLIRYRQARRWGFADRHGHPLGRQTFLLAGDFYEGRAAVLTETGWGLLRRDGTYALPPDREQLEWYGPDNVATAARDGLWHLFDRCGRQLTETGADWMGEPSEGRILFRRGSRFGFIGLDGRPVTPLRFDEAYSFRNGQAWVRIQGDSFRIDPDGHRIG